MELVQPLFNIYLPTFIYSGVLNHSFTLAAIAYLGSIVVFNFEDLKNKYILPTSGLFGFVLFLVTQFQIPSLKYHPWLMSSVVMFTVTSVSVLIKKPFTIQYSKRNVPESKWSHPVFYKINFIISMVWCLYFAISVTFNIMSILNHRSYAIESCVPLIMIILFTLKFPDYYRNKKGTKAI